MLTSSWFLFLGQQCAVFLNKTRTSSDVSPVHTAVSKYTLASHKRRCLWSWSLIGHGNKVTAPNSPQMQDDSTFSKCSVFLLNQTVSKCLALYNHFSQQHTDWGHVPTHEPPKWLILTLAGRWDYSYGSINVHLLMILIIFLYMPGVWQGFKYIMKTSMVQKFWDLLLSSISLCRDNYLSPQDNFHEWQLPRGQSNPLG